MAAIPREEALGRYQAALRDADNAVVQLRTVMQEMSLCFNVRHTASA